MTQPKNNPEFGEYMDNPSNSNKAKKAAAQEASSERAPLEKVVSGEVIKRKRSIGSRIKVLLFGGEMRTVSSHLVGEVLLPAMRDMIVNTATQGVERMVYGESRAQRRRSPGPVGYSPHIKYNTSIVRPASRGLINMPDQPPHPPPSGSQAEEFILSTRDEALLVVERMNDIIDKYQVASMADLYELMGLPVPHVANKWGWVDLRRTEIKQIREGYLLSFPELEPI